jgi:shikimate kinase
VVNNKLYTYFVFLNRAFLYYLRAGKLQIMKVFLVGYMASGKSRLGLDLSDVTGYPCIDLDDVFEERYRISVHDFFDKYDESSFRRLEQELLLETEWMPNAIVSTGGGTPCFFRNMEFMKAHGVTIYLRVNARILAERLHKVKRKRPLLTNIVPEELETTIRKHLEEREPYYLQADHIIEAQKVEAGFILKLIPDLPQII